MSCDSHHRICPRYLHKEYSRQVEKIFGIPRVFTRISQLIRTDRRTDKRTDSGDENAPLALGLCGMSFISLSLTPASEKHVLIYIRDVDHMMLVGYIQRSKCVPHSCYNCKLPSVEYYCNKGSSRLLHQHSFCKYMYLKNVYFHGQY